jgi:enterochelin esterase-like enzyme
VFNAALEGVMKYITSFVLVLPMMLTLARITFCQQAPLPAKDDPRWIEQLKTATQNPIINNDEVTFIYRGDAQEVELVGEMTYWDRCHYILKPLADTNIRFVTLKFPADARLEYKFLIDGLWELDPLNPNKNDNDIGGENNFFLMPSYQPNFYAIERNGVDHGRIVPLDLPADAAGRKREARVYLPPGYDTSSDRYPTIYFADGIDYINRAKANLIVDNLIAEGRMRPVVMVFLAPLDRMKEYWMNKAYVDWLVETLVPMIDAKYRTIPSPSDRAHAGASLGGLTSIYAAFMYPETFGLVLGQSPSLQVNRKLLINDMRIAKHLPFKLYIEFGNYEDLSNNGRALKETLRDKGYKFSYKEVNFGHNWAQWSDELAGGLVYLFPNEKSSGRVN